MVIFHSKLLPSGYVKIAMERSTIFHGKIHYNWPFSIAMLNYQRVNCQFCCLWWWLGSAGAVLQALPWWWEGPFAVPGCGGRVWTSKTRHVWQFPTKDTNGCAWSWQFQYSKWLLTAGFAMFPSIFRHTQYVAHIPTWTHYEPNIIQYIRIYHSND